MRNDWNNRVLGLLCELGNSPDGVAAKLENLYVVGERNDKNHCVLATYLNVMLRTDSSVRKVTVRKSRTIVHTKLRRRHKVYHQLPIIAFLANFDRGVYPALDRYSSVASGDRTGYFDVKVLL